MQMKKTLTEVYHALQKKGYIPIDQIVGYLLSEDPTYITNYNNARAEIRKIDRDDLLKAMVQQYLNLK
ncbi:MAG: IreB family regulatory phosphoprotein [Oscillospiraceae bacterium]|nr:IreB family regulatory phosphoprotein [Oscillospiraceae bacterium]